MRLLVLALRNLTRNLRRTLLTLAAVSVGLSVMIFTVNMQSGMYGAMIEAAISSMGGHVVIEATGYREDQDAEKLVTGASDVEALLRERFPYAVVAPRMFVGGLLMSANNSVGAVVDGIDAAAEARVQALDEKLVEGAWLDSDDRAILVGRAMADSLGVQVGDKLVFMGQQGEGEVDSRLFRVGGIFRTGTAELDGFVAFTPIAATQALMGQRDVAHMITLHLDDPDQAEAAASRIAAELARSDLEVLLWRDALRDLFAIIQVDRASGDVMLAVIGLIVAFGVLNTMLMSVLERTREFGVMLALDMKPGQIAWLVLLEGVVLGLVGAVGGILLGLLLSWPIVAHGLDISSWVGGQETMETGGFAIDAVVRGRWDPVRMAIYFVGTVVFCGLAALYPAWSISRLQPVQAMRHH